MDRQLTVWSHDAYTNPHDVLLHPSALPNAKEGDLAQIKACNEETGQVRHFNFIIGPSTENATIQISISSQILSALLIKPRQSVTVQLISKESVTAEFVELRFRGYYLTRADIYAISKLITGKCLRIGQRIPFLGGSIRLTAETIYRNDKKKYSAYIGPDTRIVYRSESARLIIMIQLSVEMWDFDETGEIGFGKLINSFLPESLRRFNKDNVQHTITIILFTSLPDSNRKSRLLPGELEPKPVNHYRVAVDSAPVSQWSDILTSLRREFIEFKNVLVGEGARLSRQPLAASKGNILEALRLTTTFTSNKFSDRDLCRTCLEVSVITASPGLFDCDEAELYQLSKIILGVEIGIELICLARPPLHITPMFRAKTNGGVVKHYIPTWMNVSFWGPTERYVKQWIPRCKIYDIQMMGVMENEMKAISVRHLHPGTYTSRFMKNYDSSIFKTQENQELHSEKEEPADFDTSAVSLQPAPVGSAHSKPVAFANNTVALPEMVVNTEPAEADGNFPAMNHRQLRDSLGSVLRRSSKPKQRLQKKISTNTFRSALNSVRDITSPILSSTESIHSTATPSVPQFSIDNSPPLPRSLEWLKDTGSMKSLPDTMQAGLTMARAIPMPIPDSRNSTLPKARGQQLLHQQEQHRLETKKLTPQALSPIQKQKLRMSVSKSPSKFLSGSKNSGLSPRIGNRVPTAAPAEPLSIVSQGSMWRVLKNPSVIDHPTVTEAYGRWAYVYSRGMKSRKIYWNSLNAPACLPLTSDVFPTVAQFNQEYKFQFYSLAVIPDQGYMSTPQLLDELIGARLQMGFQIAVGSGVTKVEANSVSGNPKLLKQIIPQDNFVGVRLYMIREGLIHRLSIEQDDLINVRIYTWVNPDQRLASAKPKHNDKVYIRTKYDEHSRRLEGNFFDPLSQFNINWNLLDQQLVGLIDYFNDPSAQYTRAIRFVIVPVPSARADHTALGDKLTIEDVRIEGILKVVTNILKHRVKYQGQKNPCIAPQVGFYTGFLNNAPQSLFEEMQETQENEGNRLNKSISLQQLAAELKGKWGPQLNTRRWHWKTFHSAVLGDVLVNWLLHNFSDISSREDASKYAQSLVDQGFLGHVEKRFRFHDGHYFYQLAREYRESEDGEKKKDSAHPERKRVSISRSLILDVDPKRLSNRPEVCQIHIDRFHNPEHSFNILIEWLNTTPRLIDEFFNGISRVCNNYALRLVQVPQADIADTEKHSPFRSFFKVKFCIDPLSVVPEPDRFKERPLFFHHRFLKRMGFIFDGTDVSYNNELYQLDYSWRHERTGRAQYIHHSGAVIVQVLEDMSFYMVPNSIFLSRYVSGGSVQTGIEDTIQSTFAKICSSPTALEDIFIEAINDRGGDSCINSETNSLSGGSSINTSSGNTSPVLRGRTRAHTGPGPSADRLENLHESNRSRSRSREPGARSREPLRSRSQPNGENII